MFYYGAIFRPTYTSFRASPKYCSTVSLTKLASANVGGYGDVNANGIAGVADMIQVSNPTALGTSAQYTYPDVQIHAEVEGESERDPEVYEEVYAKLEGLVGWQSRRLCGTSADNVG
jgi:hypothetical protein